MIKTFDVCIIGGSLAGNYLSYLLSHTSLQVAVIEEHEKIGQPLQCAGIISQKLTKLINIPSEIILNRVTTARVVSPSGKYIDLAGEEKPYIIDRVALDKYYYKKAKTSENITYFLGEKYKQFAYKEPNGQSNVIITTSKRKISTKLLVGCDGPFSAVARDMGIKNRNIYASQIRIEMQFSEDQALMYFDPHWKELFGWVVPEGNGICRVGLASAENPAENFRRFLKILSINPEKQIDKQGGAIPYGLMNQCAFDRVLLIGDSAGQVKATTGGGIIMLLTAAKIAALCIKKCFKQQNFSENFIRNHYENLCRASLGKELKLHYLIRIIFEQFNESDFDTFFQIIKSTNIENIISLYGDMDFPRQLVIKLLSNSHVIRFLLSFLGRNPFLIFKLIGILKS